MTEILTRLKASDHNAVEMIKNYLAELSILKHQGCGRWFSALHNQIILITSYEVVEASAGVLLMIKQKVSLGNWEAFVSKLIFCDDLIN